MSNMFKQFGHINDQHNIISLLLYKVKIKHAFQFSSFGIDNDQNGQINWPT